MTSAATTSPDAASPDAASPGDRDDAAADHAWATGLTHRLVSSVASVLRGHDDTVRLVVCALASGGHVLLEDIPGVGKTTLAKALAQIIGGEFRRIQFTPDLLPGDITGGSVLNPGEGTFRFPPGPIFANVVLVDEINRATPKTQSSLLEAMEERTVTTDGETRILPRPFSSSRPRTLSK